MLPNQFWVPWAEIDPSLAHGGIAGVLGDGWVGPRLGDNLVTKNQDVMMIFNCVRDAAASLSQMPGGNVEGPPTRNDLEEVLKAWNWICERVVDRTTPATNRIFQWTHATPVNDPFRLRPIFFPLRKPAIHDCIYHLLGTLVEIAESNANGLHSRLDIQSGHRIVAPLWHVKANMMRDWFDEEVAGEISEEELERLVGTLQPRAPVYLDQGTPADTPEEADVLAEKQGADVLKWYPDEPQWTTFAKKRGAMYIPERIFQPEGALRTTEDVSPETPVVGGPSGQP